MKTIRPFFYDRAESYFAVAEREAERRYKAMRSTRGRDEWFDLLPHTEPKRVSWNHYNYDRPFYRSHGKRGRK